MSRTEINDILEQLADDGHAQEVLLDRGDDGPEGVSGVWCDCHHRAPLHDATVLESHLADAAVVDLIACPRCGATGTVVLRTDPGASELHADALAALDDETYEP